MKYNKLTNEELYVIEDKGTERPFSGQYNDFYEKGVFTCKKCGSSLYKSEDKFSSACGWPNFDDEIKDSVLRVSDIDGLRVEIVCSSCKAHLGHIFEGEGFTKKNTRHCVNSISLKFQSKDKSCKEHAVTYLAAGCFWGVEYHLEKLKGVYSAISGYMGGHLENPNYASICTGTTGHLEIVKVEYDECQISFKELLKQFFEIHDFTQTNGQGSDIGSQYLSAIFYVDETQKENSLEIINELEDMDYNVATSLYKVSKFYKAEEYHQDYYEKNGKNPYCHTYKKIFK